MVSDAKGGLAASHGVETNRDPGMGRALTPYSLRQIYTDEDGHPDRLEERV